MRSENSSKRTATAVLAMAILPGGAGAAITWDGGAHNFQWSTGQNWVGNVEPTFADDVVFPADIPDGIGSIQLDIGEAARSITFNENYDLSFGSIGVSNFNLGINTVAGTSVFIDSVLTGQSGMVKSGAGALTLLGANTFTGEVDLFGGLLRVSADTQFGAAGNAVRISHNSGFNTTLAINGSFSTARTWTVHGNQTLDVAAGCTLTHSGAIANGSGSNDTLHKAGAGTLVLNGLSSVGSLVVDAGTVNLGVNNGWYSHGYLFGTGGTFDLAGFNQSFRQLLDTPIINSGQTTSTITITLTGTRSAPLDGNIALIHTGTGIVSLTGSNSYTGGTTVNGGGTLAIGADDRLGAAGTTLVLAGSTLRALESFTLARPMVVGGGSVTVEADSGKTMTITGNVTGGVPLSKTGQGTVVLAGSNPSGHTTTTVNAGTLVLQKAAPGITAAPADVSIGDGAGVDTLRLGQSEQIVNSAAMTIASSGVFDLSTFNETITSLTMSGGGGVTGTGTLTLGGGGGVTINASAASVAISPEVNLAGLLQLFTVPNGAVAAELTVSAPIINGSMVKIGGGRMDVKHFRNFGPLSIVDGTVRLMDDSSAAGVSVVESVACGISAKLDLRDNKLIVTGQAVGSWNGSSYTNVTGLIQSGRGSGTWDGARGIITSMPDALNDLTTIGIATGEQFCGLGPTDTDLFAGQTINGLSVVAMYTYTGDANLDGFIDGTDYFFIDSNVGTSADGYANGDFNYDGAIDGTDYFFIDSNITLQGAPFSTSELAGLSVVAVPEPRALVAIVGAWGISASRRSRRVREDLCY